MKTFPIFACLLLVGCSIGSASNGRPNLSGRWEMSFPSPEYTGIGITSTVSKDKPGDPLYDKEWDTYTAHSFVTKGGDFVSQLRFDKWDVDDEHVAQWHWQKTDPLSEWDMGHKDAAGKPIPYKVLVSIRAYGGVDFGCWGFLTDNTITGRCLVGDKWVPWTAVRK